MKSYVWSAGSDGLIKEWNMTGEKRECLRQVAPPGSEKGRELRKKEKTCYLLHVFFNVMLLSFNSHIFTHWIIPENDAGIQMWMSSDFAVFSMILSISQGGIFQN